MKVEVKKAYKNQKCMECGTVINGDVYIATPSCTSTGKSWRLCKSCAEFIEHIITLRVEKKA